MRAIGLGVNEHQVCEEALKHGDWDCFLLAGRYTLLEQEPLDTLLLKCVASGCSIIVGGPYNSGILASGVRGPGPLRYNYAPAPDRIKRKVAGIERVCDAFKVPLAAAALQFPLAHPAVVSVIPGIGDLRWVEQTLRLFAIEIPDGLWTALREEGLIREGAPTPRSD